MHKTSPQKPAFTPLFGSLMFALISPSAAALEGADVNPRPSARSLDLPDYRTKKLQDDLIIVPKSDKVAPPSDTPKTLRIQSIHFSGNTVVATDVLQQMGVVYLNTPISESDLEDLRLRITRHYIDQGYINSGATYPKNALQDGILSVKIIEGHLDEVRIKGQEWLREGYIANRLQPEPDAPLNMKQLQERFQLLLTDPLIAKMDGRLLPGVSRGHSILDVEVKRARPYQVAFLADNSRPPSIGSESVGVNAWLRNGTGLGDFLDFTFQSSDGSDRFSGSWMLPLSDYGTTGYVRLDEGSSSVLEEKLQALHIDSQIHNLEGGINQTLFETLTRRLNLGLNFAVRQNETSMLGQPWSFVPGEPTGHNQATVMRFTQEYLERFEQQVVIFRSVFSLGLNALGSTPERNPANPDSEFFAWLGQGQYAHRLFDNGARLVMRGNLQFSNDPLLPLERIAVGGINTVRGYRENQLVRDNGYSSSIEVQWPLLGNNSLFDQQLTLIPFMDYGAAWNQNEATDYLHSVGIGFNWKIKHFQSDFYWAHPLITPTVQQHGNLQDEGIHFRVRLDAF